MNPEGEHRLLRTSEVWFHAFDMSVDEHTCMVWISMSYMYDMDLPVIYVWHWSPCHTCMTWSSMSCMCGMDLLLMFAWHGVPCPTCITWWHVLPWHACMTWVSMSYMCDIGLHVWHRNPCHTCMNDMEIHVIHVWHGHLWGQCFVLFVTSWSSRRPSGARFWVKLWESHEVPEVRPQFLGTIRGAPQGLPGPGG